MNSHQSYFEFHAATQNQRASNRLLKSVVHPRILVTTRCSQCSAVDAPIHLSFFCNSDFPKLNSAICSVCDRQHDAKEQWLWSGVGGSESRTLASSGVLDCNQFKLVLSRSIPTNAWLCLHTAVRRSYCRTVRGNELECVAQKHPLESGTLRLAWPN